MLRFDPFGGADLAGLTVQDFQRVVEERISEGLWVEYKAQWTAEKVARAVASFANSDSGGTVIVGIAADGLEPSDAPGFLFEGEVETAVVNTVRSNVAPIPSLEVGAATLDNRRHWLAVRVPAGTDPPYVLKNGSILIRTPTSSEPVRLTDRDAMDRLYARGQRGDNWGKAQREKRLTATHAMSGFPQWIKFWTIPCVDGGLDVADRIHREPFIDSIASLDFTGWGTPNRTPHIETNPTSLTIRQTLWNEVTLTVGQDGTIETSLSRGKTSSSPDATREPMTYEELRQTLGPTCRIHRAILESHFGYSGKIVFGLSGGLWAMGKAHLVEYAPNPFPVHMVSDEIQMGRTERTIRRFFSPTIPEP